MEEAMDAQRVTELRELYNTDEHDIVRNPGKFEGEWLPTVYYWDLVLRREHEDCLILECGLEVSVFAVNEDDLDLFPDLARLSSVAVWLDDSGFVLGKYYTSAHELYKDWAE